MGDATGSFQCENVGYEFKIFNSTTVVHSTGTDIFKVTIMN